MHSCPSKKYFLLRNFSPSFIPSAAPAGRGAEAFWVASEPPSRDPDAERREAEGAPKARECLHHPHRIKAFSSCILVLLIAVTTAFAQSPRNVGSANPQQVTFQSGNLQLHGFLWRPNGPGPFPAVLWNHGSEKLPGWRPELGEFYTSHYFVFFVPHRRGQGRSPGDYIQDLIEKAPPAERARRMVELQDAEVEDVVAALNYLKSLPFVDPQRIAISGCSYGGIQTLLAGERDLGVRALVPFAPAAMSWEGNQPLRERLISAVDHAKAPIFMIQAKNDFNLGPTQVLSKEAEKKHKDFQSKIYPASGSTHQDGHRFCVTGTDVWGADVLSFLAEHMKGTH
jgi:dienelactone hydrolase